MRDDLVQAGGHVKRWTRQLSTGRATSRQGAGLLLVVLLAHLMFMASPLHDARIGTAPDQGSVAALSSASPFGPLALVATSRQEHDGHCVIEWTTVSQFVISVTLLATPVSHAVNGSGLLIASPLIARAIGPPAEGDPQAVLQVFRL